MNDADIDDCYEQKRDISHTPYSQYIDIYCDNNQQLEATTKALDYIWDQSHGQDLIIASGTRYPDRKLVILVQDDTLHEVKNDTKYWGFDTAHVNKHTVCFNIEPQWLGNYDTQDNGEHPFSDVRTLAHEITHSILVDTNKYDQYCFDHLVEAYQTKTRDLMYAAIEEYIATELLEETHTNNNVSVKELARDHFTREDVQSHLKDISRDYSEIYNNFIAQDKMVQWFLEKEEHKAIESANSLVPHSEPARALTYANLKPEDFMISEKCYATLLQETITELKHAPVEDMIALKKEAAEKAFQKTTPELLVQAMSCYQGTITADACAMFMD